MSDKPARKANITRSGDTRRPSENSTVLKEGNGYGSTITTAWCIRRFFCCPAGMITVGTGPNVVVRNEGYSPTGDKLQITEFRWGPRFLGRNPLAFSR
jgi:hypothetical protein